MNIFHVWRYLLQHKYGLKGETTKKKEKAQAQRSFKSERWEAWADSHTGWSTSAATGSASTYTAHDAAAPDAVAANAAHDAIATYSAHDAAASNGSADAATTRSTKLLVLWS